MDEKIRKIGLGIVLPILMILLTLMLSQRRVTVEKPSSPTVPSTIPLASAGENEMILLHNGVRNPIKLEDYIVGVVLAEMPASFHLDALRAQAVAARTYGVKTCAAGDRHGKNTICGESTCCQGYISVAEYRANGGSADSVQKVRQAVLDTEGLVAKYGGSLIDATFFSCSGGRTEDALAVWGNDIPYLQSVESAGEEEGNEAFSDRVAFTPQELQNALGVSISGPVDGWFGNVTYTDGGGVDTIVIGGKLYRGTTLRSLLGLRSTAFEVTINRGEIVFHTKGYGHRVGMSQYGANAMAKLGCDYSDILRHYYTGIDIVQISSLRDKD